MHAPLLPEEKNKTHHENIQAFPIAKDCTYQVPYLASLSDKYTHASSEKKKLYFKLH